MCWDPYVEYMTRAITLARNAAAQGEVPVGAVVVQENDGITRIVGEGANCRESARSPLAHAEIIAIQKAAETLGGWRLVRCTLYVTLEPCVMCTGAISQSQINTVVFGARDEKGGALLSNPACTYGWRPEIVPDILGDEAQKLLSEFFRDLRARKKN